MINPEQSIISALFTKNISVVLALLGGCCHLWICCCSYNGPANENVVHFGLFSFILCLVLLHSIPYYAHIDRANVTRLKSLTSLCVVYATFLSRALLLFFRFFIFISFFVRFFPFCCVVFVFVTHSLALQCCFQTAFFTRSLTQTYNIVSNAISHKWPGIFCIGNVQRHWEQRHKQRERLAYCFSSSFSKWKFSCGFFPHFMHIGIRLFRFGNIAGW